MRQPEGNQPPFSSPLWMVSQEPALHDLVHTLDTLRADLMADPEASLTLRLSPRQISEAQDAFARTLLRGERRLHRFCELMCEELLEEGHAMQSVIIGEVETTGERFTLIRDLTRDELHGTTDLDLGTRQLMRLKFHDGEGWSGASLVANFVEYQPLSPGAWGVHKLVSRIKAEEELWNKVVDELFHTDQLVERDKQLRHLSRYVKDVLGVKIVVANVAAAHRLQSFIDTLAFDEARLAASEIASLSSTRRPAVLEVKDYLSEVSRKKSGWAAIKSVVWWWEIPVEIQLQPLSNYLREREHLTHESHASFKAHREALRDQIAAQLPLFGFYRDLLKWIFLAPEGPAPAHGRLEVVIG